MIATDQVAHRMTAIGTYPTGLGRWTWMTFCDKNNIMLRVVTGYRPCEAPGISTTYQQQLRYFRGNNDNRDPRTAFYEDLFQDVSVWKQEGDRIIIGLDANEDVRKGETSNFFQAVGMKEAILNSHTGRDPPATYNRNMNREPIDGMWVT